MRIGIPLAESEETLVPKDRKFFTVAARTGFVGVRQSDEMEYECVDDFVRQLVFLVDEHSHEQ